MARTNSTSDKETISELTTGRLSVQIYTAMHPWNADRRRREEFGKPVEIGSDVWVGGGAIILRACGSGRVP